MIYMLFNQDEGAKLGFIYIWHSVLILYVTQLLTALQ